MADIDLSRIYPEGRNRRSVLGRLPHPQTHLRQLAVGFDCDPGSWHNRLVDYRPAEYELLYILEGAGEFSTPAGSWRVAPGDLLQRFPDRPSTLRYEHPQEQTRTCYLIVPAQCYELCAMSGGLASDEPLIRHGIDAGIIDCYRELYSLLRDIEPMELSRCMGRCVDMLVTIHRRLRSSLQRGDPDRALVDGVCRYITSRPEQRLLVAELAAEAGCSEARLRRLFHAQLGSTPGRYAIERRIERACDLLYAGRSISAVAEGLGYPDVYTFSKQFKRFTGRNPGRLVSHG